METSPKTEEETETGKVYVVHNDWIRSPAPNGATPYKIGITKKSVSERYYGLGLKMPGEFVCDCAYEFSTGYEKVETALHKMLNNSCVGGEWYNINGDTLTGIKAICDFAGGKDVTKSVGAELADELNDGGEELEDEGGEELPPPIINPYLEKIVTRWDAVSEMKTLNRGDSTRRRIPISGVEDGAYYRFIINAKVHIGLRCRKDSACFDVLGGFDRLDIKGHIFTYKKYPKDNPRCAYIYTLLPLTTEVDAVVEVMRLLIEATKDKIIEAYNKK